MSTEGLIGRLITAAAATTVIYTALGGSFSDVTAVLAMLAVVIWVQEEIIDLVKRRWEEDDGSHRSASRGRRESAGDAAGYRENVR